MPNTTVMATQRLVEAGPAGRKRMGTTLVRRLPSAVFVYLLIGLPVAVGTATGVFGRFGPDALFAIGVITTVAMIVSVWVRRPSRVWPWAAIALALALFLAAAARAQCTPTMGNLTSSRPLLSDLLALPGYPSWRPACSASRTECEGRHLQSSVVLDGLLAGLALAASAWAFAIQPLLRDGGAPLRVTLVLIAYPSMSSFMVVVTLSIVFNPTRSTCRRTGCCWPA